MKKIEIICDDTIGNAIVANIEAILAVGGNVNMTVERNYRPKVGTPRIRYKAVDAVDGIAVADKLAKLGGLDANGKPRTMTGLVFMEIVRGTIDGRVVTEAGITAGHNLETKTTQRAIVDLNKLGFITKEAIQR